MSEPHGEFYAELDCSGGLFRAVYRGDVNAGAPAAAPTGAAEMLDTHIGVDAAAVKAFVEQLAAARGFSRVVWGPLPAKP